MGCGKPICIVHMSFVLELEDAELDGLVVVLLHRVFKRAWVFRMGYTLWTRTLSDLVSHTCRADRSVRTGMIGKNLYCENSLI